MDNIKKEYIVYKVIGNHFRDITPYYSYCTIGKLELSYALLVETRPKIGGIFVFKNLRCAKRLGPKNIILKCKSYSSPKRMRVCVSCLKEELFEDFWNGKKISFYNTARTARGTRIVYDVTPIEVIEG